MRKILAALMSFLVLAMPVAAHQELASAGLTPKSPLYGLDKFIERIQLALTFDEAAKARLHYKFAEERLAETEEIAEDNPELVDDLLEEYEDELNETNTEIEAAIASGRNVTDLIDLVSEATSKHLEVLEEVLVKVPDQAKPAIQRALEVSARANQKIAERLEDGKELVEEIKERIGEENESTESAIGEEIEKIQSEETEELETNVSINIGGSVINN